MALPRMNAATSLASSSQRFQGHATEEPPPGVEMALSFTCLLGCGAGVLKCITCGTNIPCWIGCAGPDVVSCVTKCL